MKLQAGRFETAGRGFSAILPFFVQKRHFLGKSAPVCCFGTDFAYSSAKTKNNGSRLKPGPQPKEVLL
jgi:hypothetical protein